MGWSNEKYNHDENKFPVAGAIGFLFLDRGKYKVLSAILLIVRIQAGVLSIVLL